MVPEWKASLLSELSRAFSLVQKQANTRAMSKKRIGEGRGGGWEKHPHEQTRGYASPLKEHGIRESVVSFTGQHIRSLVPWCHLEDNEGREELPTKAASLGEMNSYMQMVFEDPGLGALACFRTLFGGPWAGQPREVRRDLRMQLSGSHLSRLLPGMSLSWACKSANVVFWCAPLRTPRSITSQQCFQAPSSHDHLHDFSAGRLGFFWNELFAMRLAASTAVLSFALQSNFI